MFVLVVVLMYRFAFMVLEQIVSFFQMQLTMSFCWQLFRNNFK